MPTLLDAIKTKAEEISQKRYAKPYKDLIPIRQEEVWFDARLEVEEHRHE